MKSFYLFLGIALTALFLTGCTSIPGVRTPASIEINGNSIDGVVGSARQLRSEYIRNISLLSEDLDGSAKFKLIDGTALAAASLFGGNRNVLSFFGLAGGASVAIDGTFSPTTQLNAYESGQAAISCMVDRAMAIKSSGVLLSSFYSRKTTLMKSATESLAIAPKKITIQKNDDGEDVSTEQIDEQTDVKNALFTLLQKAGPILESDPSSTMVDILKTNVITLDQSVRKKIRSALKPQEATGIRDQLITQAVEAQTRKQQARDIEISIQTLNSLHKDSFRDMSQVGAVLSAAADAAAFDVDLKKCAANVGL